MRGYGPLQPHAAVGGLFTMSAAFPRARLRSEPTGAHQSASLFSPVHMAADRWRWTFLHVSAVQRGDLRVERRYRLSRLPFDTRPRQSIHDTYSMIPIECKGNVK